MLTDFLIDLMLIDVFKLKILKVSYSIISVWGYWIKFKYHNVLSSIVRMRRFANQLVWRIYCDCKIQSFKSD